MRVLLRDVVSGEYFVRQGLWEVETARAFDFRTTTAGYLQAIKAGPRKLEIVLSFEDPRFDMVIPVTSATEASGWREDTDTGENLGAMPPQREDF